MQIDRLIKLLLPQNDVFFVLLERGASCVARAGELVVSCVEPDSLEHQGKLIEQLHDIEHESDAIMREVSEKLNRTFVTPIDRGDIYALATQLENVVDAVFATARQLKVHAMLEVPPGSVELAKLVRQACGHIHQAVPMIRKLEKFDEIRRLCGLLSSLEQQGDVIFGDQIGTMFKVETDAIRLLKHKEFLEGLERTLDVCDRVGTALDTILIKNA